MREYLPLYRNPAFVGETSLSYSGPVATIAKTMRRYLLIGLITL